MRYAFISDIHGNLEALQAVLEALSKDGPDAYLCIGDVVGYGADPVACINLVKKLAPKALIAGNHEWGTLGLTDIEYFNEAARAAIIWTAGVLGRDELDYLKSFRLVYEDAVFTVVHGTLNSPGKFHYILDSDDAYPTIKLMKNNLCFIGHSHMPGIFCHSQGRVERVSGPKVKIEPGKKYVINAGSVGQPRDGDPRASYALYDDEGPTAEIRRVKYDIEGAQNKILKEPLPRVLALRLSKGI